MVGESVAQEGNGPSRDMVRRLPDCSRGLHLDLRGPPFPLQTALSDEVPFSRSREGDHDFNVDGLMEGTR